jgi:hypothetical protein
VESCGGSRNCVRLHASLFSSIAVCGTRFEPLNPTGYIQVSRDTFIELQQSNAQRPVGLNHFGLEAADINKAVATFRQRGLTVSDPGAPSAFTGGILANVTDPNAGRIELSEQPDGKLRKASESWK